METLLIDSHYPKRRYRHGHKTKNATSREYVSWLNMLRRCLKGNDKQFPGYGARGIAVCDAWRNDFMTFISDMGRCPEGKTLGRIDNDRGYEPGNCRWETPTEQARNRRSSKFLTHKGRTLTQAEWAELLGISQGTLYARLKAGWTVERALGQAVR